MCDVGQNIEQTALDYAFDLFGHIDRTIGIDAESVQCIAKEIVALARIFEDYLDGEGDETDGAE
mgnify:CR=1 FL=1